MRRKIASRGGRAVVWLLSTGEYVEEIEGTGIERIGRRVQD